MDVDKLNPFWILNNPELVEEQLKYFGSRKWKVEEFDELNTEFLNKLGIVSLEYMTLRKGATIYRARPNSRESIFNGTSDLFDNVSKLGINTRENTVNFGRANFPGKPAFYASPDPKTAIHEVIQDVKREKKIKLLSDRLDDLASGRVEVGTGPGQGFDGIDLEEQVSLWGIPTFTLSTWVLEEDLRVAYYLDKRYIPDELRKTLEWVSPKASENSIVGSYKVRKSMDLIRKFFVKQFIKYDITSPADYMLSALCADLVYRMGRLPFEGKSYGADGIMYSSVAHGYQGINFAFSESTILANKLKFVSAEYQSFISPKQGVSNGFHAVLGRAECVSEATGELNWTLFRKEA